MAHRIGDAALGAGGFDLIAIYASARLVSTGQGASVTDTVTISVAALAAAALQRSARLRLM